MKKALIVGINAYPIGFNPLRGCKNDAFHMQDILVRFYKFNKENIRLILDEDASREGILENLIWLVAEAQPGDVLVFHYSGHGSYVDDNSNDEWDCVDEILVPQDHDWDNPLRDDDIQRVFSKVPKGTNLTFISDSCHSGTVNKAPTTTEQPRTIFPPLAIQERVGKKIANRNSDYREYISNEFRQWTKEYPSADLNEMLEKLMDQALNRFKENRYQFVETNENNILLAACQDKQTSVDAFIDNDWHGAFTYFLHKTIKESNGELTYNQLITRTGKYLLTYQQIPQLECPPELKAKQIFDTS